MSFCLRTFVFKNALALKNEHKGTKTERHEEVLFTKQMVQFSGFVRIFHVNPLFFEVFNIISIIIKKKFLLLESKRTVHPHLNRVIISVIKDFLKTK